MQTTYGLWSEAHLVSTDPSFCTTCRFESFQGLFITESYLPCAAHIRDRYSPRCYCLHSDQTRTASPRPQVTIPNPFRQPLAFQSSKRTADTLVFQHNASVLFFPCSETITVSLLPLGPLPNPQASWQILYCGFSSLSALWSSDLLLPPNSPSSRTLLLFSSIPPEILPPPV